MKKESAQADPPTELPVGRLLIRSVAVPPLPVIPLSNPEDVTSHGR